MKMAPGLAYLTPDEAAETLPMSNALYARLWALVDQTEPMPAGLEFPPEPDAFPDSKMPKVWGELTEDEQKELNATYEAENAKFLDLA